LPSDASALRPASEKHRVEQQFRDGLEFGEHLIRERFFETRPEPKSAFRGAERPIAGWAAEWNHEVNVR
jgi:hypothetical protein